jgi:nucleotide-binding universal stress UspA family protein
MPARPPQPDQRPILCAVTLDTERAASLRHAWQRAASSGRPLAVAHVVHERPGDAGTYQRLNPGKRMLPHGEIAAMLLERLIDDCRASLPAAAARLEPRQVLVRGVPGGRIPELARLLRAVSIVIGASRHDRWQRFWQGSVTAQVLRAAPCPVIIVDAGGEPVSPSPPRPGTGWHAPAGSQLHAP